MYQETCSPNYYISKNPSYNDLIYYYPRNDRPSRKSFHPQKSTHFNKQPLYSNRSQLFLSLHEHQQQLARQKQELLLQDLITSNHNHKKKNASEDFAHYRYWIKEKDNAKLNYDKNHRQQKQKTLKYETSQYSISNHDYQKKHFPQNDTLKKQQNQYTAYYKKPSISPTITQKIKTHQNTRNKIMKKLYDQPKKTNYKQTKAKQNKRQELQKSMQNNEIILNQQINFLKQQLAQKTKIIIQLQCQLIKKQKNQQFLITASQQLNYQHSEDDPSSQNQYTATKRYDSGKKQLKQLQIQCKNIDLMIKSKRISTSKIVHIQKNEDHQKNNNSRSKKSFSDYCFQFPQHQQTIQTKSQQFDVKPQTQEYWTQTQCVEQQQTNNLFVDKLAHIHPQSLQYRYIPQQTEIQKQPSPDQKTSDFSKSKQSYDVIDLQIKQQDDESNKKMPQQNSKTFEIASCDVQTQNPQNINQQSQTSQNYYDYIQPTFAKLFFDKEYQQFQAKQQKQSKPAKNYRSQIQ